MSTVTKYTKEVCLSLVLMLCLMVAQTDTVAANSTMGIAGCYQRGEITNLKGTQYRDRNQIYTILYDSLMDGLYNIPKVTVCDLSLQAMQARADEAYVQMVFGQLDKGLMKAALDGFEVKPEYVMYAYLTGFTLTHRESGVSSNMAIRADISVRVLDAKSGKTVFVATGTGDADSHQSPGGDPVDIDGNQVPTDCLHKAMERACDKVFKKMRANI